MSRRLQVLLGVTGGIAAFKAPEIVRAFRERGHEVRCALSRSAASFVSPLTLEVLTGRPVHGEEYLEPTGSGEELHITAASWADVVCVAPATAHFLARLAVGLADDFLTTTLLAFEGPVIVAPAMHTAMWRKPSVEEHVAALRRDGVEVVGPVSGPLASGEVGMGRMSEPVAIVTAAEAAGSPRDLTGKTVLVTAGPTREAIDPVRFLSNRSSGRMGFALAAAAARRGARTCLVAGPVALPTPTGVERVDVTCAREMRHEVERLAAVADLIVMAAAVADFRPAAPSADKLKKSQGPPTVELEANPDILTELGALSPNALRVGFAAETHNLESEARRKLEAKNLDFIVANDVSREDVGFAVDQNEATVFARDGRVERFDRQLKSRLAESLIELFAEELKSRDTANLPGER